jgi:hypothetical protein
MIDIGIGISLEKNPILAGKEAARLAKTNMRQGKIDLAFVFACTNLSYITLLKTIAASLQDAPILGCSSSSILCNQGVFKQGVAIMALGFPEGSGFKIACVKDIKNKGGINAGGDLGGRLLHNWPNIQRILSVVFSNAAIKDSAGLLYGLQERLGTTFPLAGSYVGDNLAGLRNYIYFNQELNSDACAGILLGGRLNFGLGIRHGWKPLGKPHLISASKDNTVYSIDDKPAAELYQEYLGYNLARLKRELKFISAFYPLGITAQGQQECLLRSIEGIENDGSLLLRGNIPKGSAVRLMIGTKETCLDAAKRAAEQAKKNIFDFTTEPGKDSKREPTRRFALVFNSVSRQQLLRTDTKKEMAAVQERLGKDIPFIGVGTYAELAPLAMGGYRGKVYLYSQTINILTVEG